MDEAFETAENAYNMLWLAKTAYDCGREDLLEEWGDLTLEYDSEPLMVDEGLNQVGDFFDSKYSEPMEVGHYYFSSHAMMEYYKLCKEYEQLTGSTSRNNPYRKAAKTHVDEQMSADGCYYCGYALATKTCFKWSSFVKFNYDASYFYEYTALISRLLNVFEFYSCKVAGLRFEVWKLRQQRQTKILMLPLPREQRRAA